MNWPFTSDRYKELVRVNDEVNKGVKYVTDEQQYNSLEFWANADQTKRGDCEDYVEAKYARLRALGWPKEALNFVVVRTTTGEGHAILSATLGDYDYICDNRYPNPMAFGDSDLRGYTFVMMTKNGKFDSWYKIEK